MAAGPRTAAPPVQSFRELKRRPLEDRLHVPPCGESHKGTRGQGDEAVIAALRKPGRRATLFFIFYTFFLRRAL